MELMARDLCHPYIPSATVLGDSYQPHKLHCVDVYYIRISQVFIQHNTST